MSEEIEERQLQDLIEIVEPHGKLLRAWPLIGGISTQMTAVEVMLTDGRTRRMIWRRPSAWALQQNLRAIHREFRILQILRLAEVRVPTPYYLDYSQEVLPTPYLVIEYIEGRPEFGPANVTDFVFQMARQLAAIHRIGSADLDLSFLPRQEERLATAFGERPTDIDDSLAESRIRKALESVWPLAQRNEPVLLHGDFWPGNLLWRNGRLAAVIDWEDAELGDPLADVAIGRLDLLWIFGVEAMAAFTEFYQSLTPIDFTCLPYWDLVAALRPASRIAEWAAGWPDLGRADISESTMRRGHHWFISQAFAKLPAL